VLLLDGANRIVHANDAAEGFFRVSLAVLVRYGIDHFVPFGSPVLGLVDDVRRSGSPISEYKVDISSPRLGKDRMVDVHASPANDPRDGVVVMFQPQNMADKLDRQLTNRGAGRSVVGLAAMLGHEIKNPLSGIRGAAQLLDMSGSDDDKALTRLIMEETDRIVRLVDRMEAFADDRPVDREAVNIHEVLEQVKRLAKSGFARSIKISEDYDPSLPPVMASRDQLTQVFLNLAKNAAEALADTADGEIVLATAFRPGIHLSVPGTSERISLPLQFSVSDNGPGIPDDVKAHIFDPFVTTKPNGTGLGLALVAKIVGDHGGIVECDTDTRRTTFRILMPAWREGD
jgi:two-component system nitrogen regulation sensor histidine kinase GlnL